MTANRTQARRAGSQTSAQPGRAGRRIAKIVERWRRGTTYIRGAAPPALGRCCGIDVPALPGWAEVWLPALRAWVRFEVYFRVPTQTLTSSFPRINAGAPTTREGIKFEGKIRSVRALGLPVASEMQRRNLHHP
jgi:transglutaminase-like putative cysteine protease